MFSHAILNGSHDFTSCNNRNLLSYLRQLLTGIYHCALNAHPLCKDRVSFEDDTGNHEGDYYKDFREQIVLMNQAPMIRLDVTRD